LESHVPDSASLGSIRVLSVDLPPEPSSASRARTLAREQLGPAYPVDTLNTVALLVTELVTNAILHARTPLHLTLDSCDGHVRICVEDESQQQPAPQRYESDAVTGRGLALVEQLASSWGVDPTPSGKAVWCEVAVSEDADVRT
jgi:anti-sigma regulatory factor (Ser/Thr protein kinase)